MNEENNSKGPIAAILGVAALLLLAGILWLIFGRGGDANSISSDLMNDDTDGETAEGVLTDAESAAAGITTDGLKFVVSSNTFAAVGQANPQTKFALDPVITLTYGETAANAIESNGDIPEQPYDQAVVDLVSLMATNIEDGELEVTDTTVTATGTAPSEAFKAQFDALLSADSGFTQEIVNNITVENKAFSEVELVNSAGATTVTGTVKTAEIQQLITASSTELFGADTQVDVTVDETLFAGYSWSRFPEFVGGLRNFQNWEAGSVNNNPYATLTDGLNFEVASAQISNEVQDRLAGLLPIIFASQGQITVTGHTDSDGAAATNQGLSERRADAVVDALILAAVEATASSNALSEDDFIAVGQGATNPVAPNDTDANKALNRRVEFGIAR